MAHGIIATVPGPIEMYDQVHAQVQEKVGPTGPPGLIFHVSRQTADGFQVIEIWESKEQADQFSDEVLAPIIDRVSGGQAPPREEVSEEFVVRQLLVGAGRPTASV